MYTIHPLPDVKSFLRIPPDKSISHRALLIASLAPGTTVIDNFLYADDTVATLQALQKVGVSVAAGDTVKVVSRGKYYPRGDATVHVNESGTSIRLLSGILTAQKFSYLLTGKPSLRERPMARITVPLRLMGADIQGASKNNEEYAPLFIRPVSTLRCITYTLPVNSAQVKSALLFAGLYARGETIISQPALSRDHTERMLKVFGARVTCAGKKIAVQRSTLKTIPYLYIPGDISSAAFFIALGILLKKSEIFIEKVGMNPTRTGFLSVLRRMGAKIRLVNSQHDYFEPYADVLVLSSSLRACVVKSKEIPLLIDELPVLFVCAALARGKSRIEGVEELRVKETDRIESMLYNLRQLGVRCGLSKKRGRECVVVEGVKRFKRGARFKSFGDHRTAMSCVIAGLLSARKTTLDDVQCIDKSFPEFTGIIEAFHKL